MTLTPVREHRTAPVPAACPPRPAARPAARGRPLKLFGGAGVLTPGPALSCQDATAVITAASRQVLPSGGGRSPAGHGRSAPCAGPVAASMTPAPALPNPPGTVRHVPDLVGAVLLASAVAAGVLAISRGSAWGRSSSRSLGRAGAFAVLATGSPIPWRDRWRPRDPRRRDGPAAMTAALVAVARAAVLLAATAQVRVAGASGRETGPRSQRAAEEGPAMSRRLLAGPRGDPDQVRGEAEKERARFGAFCPSPTGTTNPR